MNLNMIELYAANPAEIKSAAVLCHRHQLSGMVVPPILTDEALLARALLSANYAIGVHIDWPNGDQKGLLKFTGAPVSIFKAGFWEITAYAPNGISDKQVMEFAANDIENFETYGTKHLRNQIEMRYAFGRKKQPSTIKAMIDGYSTAKNNCSVVCMEFGKQTVSKLDDHRELIDYSFAKLPHSIIKLSGSFTRDVVNSVYGGNYLLGMSLDDFNRVLAGS